MTPEVLLGAYVFLLAIFVGFEVIARVPSILHTPLMSGTNAIHGVVLLGAMLVAGTAETPLMHAVGFVAVVLGAANVFGGFVVTDRMLEMFKKKPAAEENSNA
ncbi:MAG TPA: NAD(P) transhydrogenase subunit alpha [Longimicrobiales bacterium]